MVIPKGRIYTKVAALLDEIGIKLRGSDRSYRPSCNDPELEVKLLKSQNIPPLLALGQHDIGFAGLDWIIEQDAAVDCLLDLKFDPVKLICAVPESCDWSAMKKRPLIAVSEYRRISEKYLTEQGIDYTFVRAYGATEVFPPEDGDLIIDNTSTGSTLVANNLKIVDTVMESTTQFITNPATMNDPAKREKVENMIRLMKSVLSGRQRVLLEMNCTNDALEQVVALLPSMRAPTVSQLYLKSGFAVKAAVPKTEVNTMIPELIKAGASDILETEIRKIL